MKVALIVPGGVDRSGTVRVIPCLLWMIERLARHHEVHVFALRQEPQPSHYKLLGAQIHNAGSRPRRLRLIVQFLKEHSKAKFDVIHAVWAAPPGVLAGVLGRVLGVPVLLRLTGGDLSAIADIGYGQRRTWRGRLWLRLAVWGATHITVPSDAMQRAAAALVIRAERLPWGVALDRLPAAMPRARPIDRPARLLFVGSLNRVKDPSCLLHAAKVLRDREIPFHLDLIGEDLSSGELERLARNLGLAPVARFHGFLTQDRLFEMMAAADLLLVSSRHEADPVVALEAAIAGTPTVGTAVGHLADWAPDAAAVVAPSEPTALAEAVIEVLRDDGRRVAMALSAQQRAVREDSDWSARRVLEIYEQLLSR